MINPVAIEIGPLSIRWYALCIVLGLSLAVWLTMKAATKKGLSSDLILDFILVAFPIAILGARTYYVIFQWSYYQQYPAEIFAIWNGGIAIYGGLIAGAVYLFWFCHKHFIRPLMFLDLMAPNVLLAQSIGRWGNFVNQEAYGRVVHQLDYLPKFIRDQMYIDGHYRVPTFLYESIWNFIGFIILTILARHTKCLKEGEATYFYLLWYGFGRFIIEGMRTDSLMLAGLRVSQWVSLLLLLLGLVAIIFGRFGKNRSS